MNLPVTPFNKEQVGGGVDIDHRVKNWVKCLILCTQRSQITVSAPTM